MNLRSAPVAVLFTMAGLFAVAQMTADAPHSANADSGVARHALGSRPAGSRTALSSSSTEANGAELWHTTCASCHGDDAGGTRRGPSLLDEGPAAVDWVLRTGRMPLADPGDQAVARADPRFDREQIDAIIAHLGSLGMRGPDIPTSDVTGADGVNGGQIFRENCASCHQAVAQGGVVNGGRDAPSLQGVDALSVAEVLRIGPGVMPNFSDFSSEQVADVTAWITEVGQRPDDEGGSGIGHIGPVAEGFVIWLVLAVFVLGALRWIGATTADAIVSTSDARSAPTTTTTSGSVDSASWPPSVERLGVVLVVTAGAIGVVRWIASRFGSKDTPRRSR